MKTFKRRMEERQKNFKRSMGIFVKTAKVPESSKGLCILVHSSILNQSKSDGRFFIRE